MTTPNTDVTKKDSNLPSANLVGTSWGIDKIDSRFMKPDDYGLMNFGRPEVKNEQYKPGEIVSKNSGEVVAGRGKSLDFVLCYFVKVWHEHMKPKNSKEYEFVSSVPDSTKTLSFKNWEEWETEEGSWRRYEVNKLFILPTSDLDGIPCVLTCKKSNLKHSVRLFGAIRSSCRTLADNVYTLDSLMEKYEDHDYYVFSFKKKSAAEPGQNAAAAKWYQKLSGLSESALSTATQNESDEVPF